jgi:hypothetical protein
VACMVVPWICQFLAAHTGVALQPDVTRGEVASGSAMRKRPDHRPEFLGINGNLGRSQAVRVSLDLKQIATQCQNDRQPANLLPVLKPAMRLLHKLDKVADGSSSRLLLRQLMIESHPSACLMKPNPPVSETCPSKPWTSRRAFEAAVLSCMPWVHYCRCSRAIHSRI